VYAEHREHAPFLAIDVVNVGWWPPSSTMPSQVSAAVATTRSIGRATSVDRVVLPAVTAMSDQIGAGHVYGELEGRRATRPKPPPSSAVAFAARATPPVGDGH
jgi:hypothetical protein